MITFKLNGQTVQGEEGQYIIDVAEQYGVEIPTLCNHKALEPAGMCRICAVEVFDGRRTRFVTSCNYPIWEGMEVKTDTKLVSEGRKLILELLLARCPETPAIRELADKYGVTETRFTKGADTCIICGLCTRVCEKMGARAISLTGRGIDTKVDTAYSLNTEACFACGACAFMCPTGHITLDRIKEHFTTHRAEPIKSEYDVGLQGRKPIYVPYAQAVPNTPVIDRDVCMHFKAGGCRICSEICPVNAIDHSMEDETVELEVGSVILSPGFEPFDPSGLDFYNYDHPNVITSMEMERMLSASGPTGGHLIRLSDHQEPKKIAWLQCVGSRDMNRCDNAYCSSVCCMYAVKEAVIAKEHAGDALDCSIFYMDMRTPGKDFEKFYDNAKNKSGVNFVRSRVHTITPVQGSDELELRYAAENGDIKTDKFDIVVLSIGLQIPPELIAMSRDLGIDLSPGNFCQTTTFDPVATSRQGIFACGAFQGPKDIPQSVIDSSAAASAAAEILADSRNTRTKEKEAVPERNVLGERPRIGIFICRCGTNIAGVVDVPKVVEYAESLPFVEYVDENMFSCSQDTQENMANIIADKELNRIVVAACTPKTHEPLFQETLTDAGLNKYLFEMTNIRNQDSWVHKNNPGLATEKAKDLVRMAVAKVAQMQPLEETELSINQTAMVVGGGIAGMSAAKSLADQGFETHLVERDDHLGGQAVNLHHTAKGEPVAENLAQLISRVTSHDRIKLHLNTGIQNVDGFVGNFKTILTENGKEQEIEHGAAVLATGAQPHTPDEYSYEKDKRIITSLELDEKFRQKDPSLEKINGAAFIQCVGSREPGRMYCSRVCCTHSIENAIELKHKNPDMNVYILYRDIRTYGEKEYLYKQARQEGVIFIRYTLEDKPKVEVKDKSIAITVTDHILNRPVELNVDLLTLATAIVPFADEKLANFFKVPMNEDGFFIERHAKLGPAEFATDGVYLCGMAHYPKPIDESIAQAKAAVSRAVTLLSRTSIFSSGTIAEVDPVFCASCGVCVSICPYNAPSFAEEGRNAGKAQINPALCKGCGLCTASCRSGAIHLKGFDTDQIMSQIFEMNEAV
ncbi:MAG: FAD-dependent oxidoreductase [Desulfobacteraceae bacterium]|nr:FAD-dependent oxidoreductase [Desulfobacteraceae bacterium]